MLTKQQTTIDMCPDSRFATDNISTFASCKYTTQHNNSVCPDSQLYYVFGIVSGSPDGKSVRCGGVQVMARMAQLNISTSMMCCMFSIIIVISIISRLIVR